jgi:UDP-N-acetylglucosamine 3-dehydrogenase
MTPKIAVIGVGRWGQNHVRVCKDLQRKGVCGEIIICDSDKAAAQYVARLNGIERWYTDIDEMLEREALDGAILAVPTRLHADLALKLLPRCSVMVEKPISETLVQAEMMLESAEKNGRILAVGHVERFNPGVAALKKVADDLQRKEGIAYLGVQRIGPGPAGARTDYLGVAHDLLIHDVDVGMFLLGALPKEVEALGVNGATAGRETEIAALMTFDNDAQTLASFRASWRSGPTLKKRILQLQGYSTFVTLDYILQSLTMERGVVDHAPAKGFVDILTTYRARDITERLLITGQESEPLMLEDRNFLECLATGKKPFVDGVAGYRALRCVLAALDSMRSKGSVAIQW